MFIYALATKSDLEVNRLKIGESEEMDGVEERRKEFDKTHEVLYTRAIWDVSECSKGADKLVHKVLEGRSLRGGNYEWFGNVTIEEVDSIIHKLFGNKVVKVK
jgi:hypothetical protein